MKRSRKTEINRRKKERKKGRKKESTLKKDMQLIDYWKKKERKKERKKEGQIAKRIHEKIEKDRDK